MNRICKHPEKAGGGRKRERWERLLENSGSRSRNLPA